MAGLSVALVVAVGSQIIAWAQPREYELRAAVVTRLDPRTRSGEIRFVHPKSGRPMLIAADRIPETCEILINGAPATLADVRVGDTVSVRGLVSPATQSVQPKWVHVNRSASSPGPSSSPAEPPTPADGPARNGNAAPPPSTSPASATAPRTE